MYIVGIDIAKRNHEAVVMDGQGSVVKRSFSFANSTAGLEKFLSVLSGISQDPSEFTIGMESTSHYWFALFSALKRRGYSIASATEHNKSGRAGAKAPTLSLSAFLR